MKNPEKYKIAVIKEELVALTGNYISAILLNQFLYWQERIKDFKDFIEEENKRRESNGENKVDFEEGWMYKTAESLSEETMLGLSATSIRKYVTQLVDQGYILERTNPKYKWDKTKQYRVNFVNIVNNLTKMNYQLTGYKHLTPQKENNSPSQEFGNGKQENENQKQNNSNQTSKSLGAIPETTTEITNKDYSNNSDRESSEAAEHNEQSPIALPRQQDKQTKYPNIYKDVVDYLNKKTGKRYRHTTGANQSPIRARQKEGFVLQDFYAVIDVKCSQWLNDKNMSKYLRPETLFGKKFESYLNECCGKENGEHNVDVADSDYDENGVRIRSR